MTSPMRRRAPGRHAIKIPRLRKLVSALAQAAQLHPDTMMSSISPPNCGTPGCHAGLIWTALPMIRAKRPSHYDFLRVGAAAARYLFDSSRANSDSLKRWAKANPDLWGNYNGDGMWASPCAFDQVASYFPSRVIVDHWRGVLERCEKDTLNAD